MQEIRIWTIAEEDRGDLTAKLVDPAYHRLAVGIEYYSSLKGSMLGKSAIFRCNSILYSIDKASSCGMLCLRR